MKNTIKYFLLMSFWLCLQGNASGQIPGYCVESSNPAFTVPMNWIAPNQPNNHILVVLIWEYSTPGLTLDLNSINQNMSQLIRIGRTSYNASDKSGNCCLKQKQIQMKTISDCASQNVNISWWLGIGGQGGLPQNPGSITYNGQSYIRTGINGNGGNLTLLFRNTNGNNYLLIRLQITTTL